MSDKEQAQNAATDEIKALWNAGKSIGLSDAAIAYGVSYSDVWGILQQLEEQQQRSAVK